MTKKGRSLVDSFVFHKAKEAVDHVTKPPEKEQDHIRIISGSEQEQNNIIKGADKEQIRSRYVSGSYQDKKPTTKAQKSITIGSGSLSLSKSQTDVFLWFKARGNTGVFNKPEIQKSLPMPYITVRKAVEKLETIGILELNYDTCQKNYEYNINGDLNIKLNKNSGFISGSYQDQNNIISSPLNSSSSLINKTTTKLKTILSDHPELGYWRQKGLTPKQVAQWVKLLQCDLNTMIQYLCYCRFEMVDLDFEKSKPVDNVFNWFFRMIERIGAYPKPKNYKSFNEKQLEIDRQIAEQKEKDAIESKELYKRKIEADQDKKFWDVMNDPDSELYKQCFESLNSFQKKRTAGEGFEMSMRGAFDKLSAEGENGASEKSEIHSLHQKKGTAKKER